MPGAYSTDIRADDSTPSPRRWKKVFGACAARDKKLLEPRGGKPVRARQVADTLTVGREIRVNPPLAHTVLKQYNAPTQKRASGESVAGMAGSCREEQRTEGTLQGRSTTSALDFSENIRSGGLAEWMTDVETSGRSQTIQTQSRPLTALGRFERLGALAERLSILERIKRSIVKLIGGSRYLASGGLS